MLVRARLAGLLIMIKVKIDNKEACAKLAIRSHYLKQLQSTLKLFFYHIGRSERLPLLSAQDECYLSSNLAAPSMWLKNGLFSLFK